MFVSLLQLALEIFIYKVQQSLQFLNKKINNYLSFQSFRFNIRLLINISQPSMKTLNLIFLLFIIAQVSFCLPWISKNKQNQPLNANASCTTDCCKSLASRSPMTYYYYQNTGRLRGGTGEWAINTIGYSGNGTGRNNPEMQCVTNTGPLPATTYKMAYCKNTMHDPPVQKPCSFYLQPIKPSQMCGRNSIFIHGCQCCTTADDSVPPPSGCSAGCVIISYANRKKIRVGDTLIVQHIEPKLTYDSE